LIRCDVGEVAKTSDGRHGPNIDHLNSGEFSYPSEARLFRKAGLLLLSESQNQQDRQFR
jgi:hypothetical protein